MSDQIALVTCGPVEHGISRFGRSLAAAAREEGFTGPVVHEDRPLQLISVLDRLSAKVRLVHLQTNDWLFTDATHRAEDSIRPFARELAERGAALSLTLHDLPHRAVSPELYRRRAATYAALATEAVAVIVCSRHERLLLEEAAAATRAAFDQSPTKMPLVEVIPLPVPEMPSVNTHDPTPTSCASTGPTVGILGYVYPGKGHQEVLEELAGLADLTVLAIGEPSDGHRAMLPELEALGLARGTGFLTTGFIPDEHLTAHLRSVTVPVAPAEQISASASINSWIAAGRRPLVMAGRYTQELQDRMPGAVTLYRKGELRAKVVGALSDPASTWLPPAFRSSPTSGEVASRYLRLLRSAAARPSLGRNATGT